MIHSSQILLSFLFKITILPIAMHSGYAENCTYFVPRSECICSGQHMLFECATVGPVATVWQGSAFQCENDNILLRHSQFGSLQGESGMCNNGLIIGHSLRVITEENCFISQLNVTLSSNLDGHSVQCAHNDGQRLNIIGSYNIILAGSFPPPNDVQLVNVYPGHLTFRWTAVSTVCSMIYYSIIATNCDIICPSTTSHTTITCTGSQGIFSTLPCTFMFTIRTVLCGNINGNDSNPISIILKELTPPLVGLVPMYSAKTSKLISITTSFPEVESYTISGDIEGAAIFYTITYAESTYGHICGSAQVPASSCINGICSHIFRVINSVCPPLSDINVTVFGVNQLGNGLSSTPVTVGAINLHVEVQFHLHLSKVLCKFFIHSPGRACSITYGPQDNCRHDMMQTIEGRDNDHQGVIINITLPKSQNNLYCFEVTATDRLSTIQVTGVFSAGCDPQQLTNNSSLSMDTNCGAPLQSLQINNGIVCYSSTDTGAVAVYSCSTCNPSTIPRTSTRTCLSNGSWNGTIPDCDCEPHPSITDGIQNHIDKGLKTIITVSTGLIGFLALVILPIFIIVTTVSIRAKSKIKKELMQTEEHTLYEEIVTVSQSVIESNKNAAYISASKL